MGTLVAGDAHFPNVPSVALPVGSAVLGSRRLSERVGVPAIAGALGQHQDSFVSVGRAILHASRHRIRLYPDNLRADKPSVLLGGDCNPVWNECQALIDIAVSHVPIHDAIRPQCPPNLLQDFDRVGNVQGSTRLKAKCTLPRFADRAEASLRGFERHPITGCLCATGSGKPTALGMIPLGSLPDLLLLPPLMIAILAAAPNHILCTFVLSEPPVRRTGNRTLHQAVRQRDLASVGLEQRRDVNVGHMT